MEFWTAFTIGLIGSLHCVGMCGPIALSLPYQDQTAYGTAGNILLYNLGRTTSYTVIGLIPGLLGLGVFISGYQSAMSVGIGLFLLLTALFSFNMEQQLAKLRWYQHFQQWLKQQFARQLKNHNRKTFLTIGILNGFLPCGLVYMAVAGALTQASITGGMLYMMFFGLGTLPLMLVLSFSGNWLSLRFRKYVWKILPVFLFLFGVLFLLRGWNVELPTEASYWLTSGIQQMCKPGW